MNNARKGKDRPIKRREEVREEIIATRILETEHERVGKELWRYHDNLEAIVKERTAALVRADSQLRRENAERKRVEEELLESDQRFTTVFECATEGILLADIRTKKFVYGNRAISRMLGYDLEKIKTLGVAVIHPKEDLPYVLDNFEKLVRREISSAGGIRVQRKDGSIFYADITSYRTKVGGRTYVIGIFRDITERKRAEEALRASEQRFRALVETTSDFVWEVDQNGFYTYANPKVKDLLGYDPEEVIGKTPFDLMPLDEAERIAKLFGDIVESGRAFATLENINLHKDGRRVVLETSGVPILDAKGNLVGYRGIDRDITERKLAEERLAEDRTLLRTLIDNLPDLIYAKHIDGRFVLANEAFVDFVGEATEQEIIGRTDFDFFPGDQAIKYYADEQVVLNSGQPLINKQEQVEDKARRGRWVLSTKAPLRDGSGKIIGLVCLNRDITDSKRSQVALEESEKRHRTFIDQSVEAIYVYDLQSGQLLEANPAFRSTLGYKAEDIPALRVSDFAGQDSKYGYGHLHEILTDGAIAIEDRQWQRKDGTLIDVQTHAARIRQGGRDLVFVIGHDITEQKRAENALRESEERYRNLVENISEVYYVSDHRGSLVYGSPNLFSFTGYTPQEIVGRSCTRLVAREDRRRVVDFYLGCASDGTIDTTCEFRSRGKDGRYTWVEQSTRISRDKGGSVIEFRNVVRDITLRKDTEERLRQAARRIIEAQEAERKRVARGLHDSVSQLLSSARFRLASAGEKIFDQTHKSYHELDDSRALIEKAVQEIRRIIRNLRPAVLDDLGLLPALRTLCEEFRERANVTLNFGATPKPARLAPEIELALFRIVQEALNNIEKHSRATRVSVSIIQNEASLQIKVKDNGAGFDRVAACKKEGNLSGYGLHSMMERAASIGGKAEIRSAIDKGTEIIVCIPLNGSKRCD